MTTTRTKNRPTTSSSKKGTVVRRPARGGHIETNGLASLVERVVAIIVEARSRVIGTVNSKMGLS